MQSASFSRKALIESFARLTSSPATNVYLSPTDLNPFDVDAFSPERIRGEIVRLTIETCVDSVDSDPNSPNIGYLLLGFDLQNMFNEEDVNLTGMHNYCLGFTKYFFR